MLKLCSSAVGRYYYYKDDALLVGTCDAEESMRTQGDHSIRSENRMVLLMHSWRQMDE
uniref:Uncharacterized protein n=1 Tax=Arundo donax TaxID=35708 RepID=A0A0A9GS80_ARUDO